MRLRYSVLLSFALISTVCLFSRQSFAEDSPESLARTIVSRLKETNNSAIILDYINWDSAFNALTPQQKTAANVATSQEYHDRFAHLLGDPKAFLQEQFEKRFAGLPPEKRAIVAPQIEKMTQMIESKFEEMRARIARTEFEIGKSEISGNNATVELELKADGQTREEKLKLVKIDGKWWLPGLQLVRDPSAPVAPPQAAPQSTTPTDAKEG